MEQSKEEYQEAVEQLIELYQEIDAEVEDFLAEQDVGMKLTTLKSIQRDIEQM